MAKQTENKVGIYLRLSQEDLREGDSVSIDNQRMILTKYVKEKGWTLVDTYVDDGWTGTTSTDRKCKGFLTMLRVVVLILLL